MNSRLISFLRDAHWLTRERIVAWGTVLLIHEIVLLGFIALLQNGVLTGGSSNNSMDFVSFYAAGKLALAGTPALAYDQAAHHLAEQASTFSDAPYQFFFYPPLFLILCSTLALLPYFVAYAVFELTTMVLFLFAMRGVLRESGAHWMAPVLAFPAVFWTIGLGQNAFLTAALFSGFTMMVDKRPVRAGVLLGMLAYKPHFGLLAPIALAASGRWRAFGSAAATVAVLVGVSTILFGIETWQAYFTAFAGSNDVYGSGRIDYAGMVTLFGAARLMGIANEHAYMVQAIGAVLMAGTIGLIWRTVPSRNLRAASLLVATLLAVPMALVYDKLLLLVAMAWLLREAREKGFLPWEKLVLTTTYPLSLLSWSIGTDWHLPLGPIVSIAVLLLSLRRVWRALLDRDRSLMVQELTAEQPSAVPL